MATTRSTRKAAAGQTKTKTKSTRGAAPGGTTRAARKTTPPTGTTARQGLPEIAAVLVDARRKDIDALQQASRSSYEGVRELVRRQVQQLKDTLGEWQAVIQVMNHVGPRQSVAQLDALGKGVVQQAMQGIRDLADLALESQAVAIAIVRKRIDDDLEEIDRLLGKSSTARRRARR